MTPDGFFTLTDQLNTGLRGTEVLFCSLTAESSDFVRLNRNRMRQGGAVKRLSLGLTLIDGKRQADAACDLSGAPREDLGRAETLIRRLRERIETLPDDPYLSYSDEPWTSEHSASEASVPSERAVSQLMANADGLDLVGIWAAGEIVEALASSLGHRHWHAAHSFNLDWSCYLTGDLAVKSSYAGTHYETSAVEQRLAHMRRGLEVMARPPRTLEPGSYRAYLTPAAVNELTDMLAWGGFDLKGHRTRQTPLLKLADGTRQFDPRVTLTEDHHRGLRPCFTPEGFRKPPRVTLVDGGRLGTPLVDAREGKEFGEVPNATHGSPESLTMAAGDIAPDQVLERLGTGLYIGNLWYCNWSDANDCRVTGMTRFGTYWVEAGEIVAPVKVMRFDDSLYHLLGDRLEGLGVEQELLVSPQTYEGRSSDSALLPGILVSAITLVL